MKSVRSLVVLSSLCMTVITSVFAADWTRWRGPNGNSTTNESNLNLDWATQPPKQLWKVNTGQSYSSISVLGNRLYTMGNAKGKDTVYCLDMETGKTVWTHSEPHAKRESQADPYPKATTATPVVDGERVYTLSREGLALCLDIKTGKVLWSKQFLKDLGSGVVAPPFGFAGSPLILGDKAIYNVGHHGVAVNKKTGAVIWKSVGLAGHATPVEYQVGTQKGVAFFNGSGIVGVAIATGKPYWEHKWKTEYNINAVDPVFDETGVFISAWGKAQKLRLVGNKPVVAYETKTMQSTSNSAIRVGGYLYGNSKGRLACMDLETGKMKWDLPGINEGNVILVGNTLLTLAEKGELILVDATPEACKVRGRAMVMEGKCVVTPALANGRLYCRNVEGDVVCFDLRK
jgi:outer membrane protein assembly factor BamB